MSLGRPVTIATVAEPVSPIPGSDRWYYGPFGNEADEGLISVPLVREDGTSATVKLPDFVNEPRDIQAIAQIVIAARERWEDREGVGG
jgi:hypothetical protein